MFELRKCLKYEWTWCDGDCEHCRVVLTTSEVPPYIQVQFVRTGGSHEEEPNPDVKHGRWIDMDDHVMCSCCGATHYGADKNYCPNCGAKMDEEE